MVVAEVEAAARAAQLEAAEVVVAARAVTAARSAPDQHCSGAARLAHATQSAHLSALALVTQQLAAAQAARCALRQAQTLPRAA